MSVYGDDLRHGDVWDGPLLSGGRLSAGEANRLKDFMHCAIANGSSSCGQAQTYHVPDEDLVIHNAPVAEDSAKLRTDTGWDGSTVKTTLVSPSERRIDQTTVADDVIHMADATSETLEVASPEPGTWTVELYGTDVPPEGEDANLTITVSPDAAHDVDADGVFDSVDNCPGAWNPGQSDVDQDGLGDACDPDIDGDGVANEPDNCPAVANPDQLDSDHNGMGDACDPGGVLDSDSDGVVDNLDNCPFDANPDQANIDGDAWGDVCDPVTDAPVGGVGGIAELPDMADSASGSPSPPYAALAGAAAAVVALAAGGWYARRRWRAG